MFFRNGRGNARTTRRSMFSILCPDTRNKIVPLPTNRVRACASVAEMSRNGGASVSSTSETISLTESNRGASDADGASRTCCEPRLIMTIRSVLKQAEHGGQRRGRGAGQESGVAVPADDRPGQGGAGGRSAGQGRDDPHQRLRVRASGKTGYPASTAPGRRREY